MSLLSLMSLTVLVVLSGFVPQNGYAILGEKSKGALDLSITVLETTPHPPQIGSTPIPQVSVVCAGSEKPAEQETILQDTRPFTQPYLKALNKYGFPTINKTVPGDFPVKIGDLRILPYREHLSIFNSKTHTGFLTIHHLPADPAPPKQTKSRKRPKFIPETKRLPKSDQVTSDDYSDTVYSRGHLVPQGDLPKKTSQKETFITTNTAPQIQNTFNDGLWNEIEACVRNWRDQGRKMTVFTGVAFDTPDKVNYLNKKVGIPSHFYKIITDESTDPPATISFLMENRPYKTDEKSLKRYITTIDTIQKKTGLSFFTRIPAPERKILVEGVSPLWKGCED